MSVKEYSYQSTQLSEYALIVVANSKTRMSKFFLGQFDMLVKECRTPMLIKPIYLKVGYSCSINQGGNSKGEV